jgi:hypothetical protein
MTDQNTPQHQDAQSGGLVFSRPNSDHGQGSIANHASISTSTGDAANILVYQQEARVKKQLRAVKAGRIRLEDDLKKANGDLNIAINNVGTSYNKHNQARFKALMTDVNASSALTAAFNAMIGIGEEEQKFNGTLLCDFHFDGSSREASIAMSASMTHVARDSFTEESTRNVEYNFPMPRRISFNTDQMPDVIKAFPDFFPDDFTTKMEKVLTLLEHAHKCTASLSAVNNEISRLNQLLTEIPSLERAARAKISEGQLRSSGQDQLLALLSESGNDLANDLLGTGDSDYFDENGQFRLPVANES